MNKPKRANLQIQDITGNWITIVTVPAQDQIIARNLESLRRQYSRTVRAVDISGNIIQLV